MIMNAFGVLGIGLFVLIVSIPTILHFIERAVRRIRLDKRDILPLDVIFREFSNCPMALEEFVTNWKEIARRLHVHPGRLRTTDTLTDLLGLPPTIFNWRSEWWDTGELLYMLVDTNMETCDISGICTLGDLLCHLAKRYTN